MPPYFFLFIAIFIFGLIIGSFLNCLIWRLHLKITLLDRSKCPKCNKMIAWYDNIPILSYLFLRGKCRHCKEKISIQYPVVELVTGLLFVVVFYVNYKFVLDAQFLIALFRDLFLVAVMIVVFIYDLKYYLILDVVTLPAIVIIFILNVVWGVSWQNMLLSAIIGGGFFLLQFVVSRGRWIGGGDIRLGFLMGVALGWPYILAALMLAYISGSIVGLGLVIHKKKKINSEVPFGVFLSVATIVTMFWGQEILNWYWGLIM